MIQTKAAIYCRVSTEVQQEKGYSLQEQEAICRKYGDERGYEIMGLYQDDISGATFDRPGTNKILGLAKRGEIQRVLVQELDRFARDATALLILEHQLKLYGVQVDYILNNFQPGAVGDFHKNIAIAVAQLEKEQIKARTSRGRMGKVKAGKVLSGARSPYGYYFENDMFCIEEEEANVVRLIFNWYAHEKLGIISIAKKLSSMNIPTRGDKLALDRKKNPGVWGVSTIHKMLHNETYIGKWFFNKTQRKQHVPNDRSEWIEVSIPAIVDEELFALVQQQSKSNTHFNKRNTKHEYLLTGMLTCVHCGRPFLASRKYTTKQVLVYYRCNSQEARYRSSFEEDAPRCQYPFLKGAQIEKLVWGIVTNYINNPDLILEAMQQQRESSFEQEQTAKLYQTTLEDEVKNIIGQEKKLLDLFLTSSIDKDLLEIKAYDLKQRREHLEEQLTVINKEYKSLLVDEKTVKGVVDYCHIMSAGLDLMDTLERREVLKLLRVRVLVNREAREIHITGLLPTSVAAYSTAIYWSGTKCY